MVFFRPSHVGAYRRQVGGETGSENIDFTASCAKTEAAGIYSAHHVLLIAERTGLIQDYQIMPAFDLFPAAEPAVGAHILPFH